MSEATVVSDSDQPITRPLLERTLALAGLEPGANVLVHCSLSRLGWVVGGAQTVLEAVLNVVAGGTILMPAFTAGNSEPRRWAHPPVPESWWTTIREHQPAFVPELSPTREMGVVAELFRTVPGALRSSHPTTSFAALGPNARSLLGDHRLEQGLGERSPLGRLYDLDGQVLLLGVGHGNNSSLHLAEHRAVFRGKHLEVTASAMSVEGERRWVEYETLSLYDDDFPQIGAAFEAAHTGHVHAIGSGTLRCFRQRPLVDFAVTWIEQNRDLGSPASRPSAG